MCRKVAEARKLGKDEIEIWGDGKQTRSFLYIDECLEGVRRLMDSDTFFSPACLPGLLQNSLWRFVDSQWLSV